VTIRFGFGFDAHRLVEGRPFVLGGVRIPFERGPLGHSDGDALAHAVADAILGGGALGDLGALFPSSDARWKDADSLALLAASVARARQAGFAVVNVDATVVVEAPRLGPHVGAMAAALAQAIGVVPSAVSVKAKTSDGMGYTGDGSGVAAYAVAALESQAEATRPSDA
jgi:2-C-methyl-D-erythritol 2,4-cyclodiphosphate synthase